MSSPSEELAKAIFQKLVQEHLLTDGEAKKLLGRAAEGKMRPEDWKLAFEKSILMDGDNV